MVCVTSMFTFESKKVIETIKYIQKLNSDCIILVGGIYASILPEHLFKNTNIIPYIGYSKELDICVPDYSINWDVNDHINKFSFVFTSRGCPNKCSYCVVSKIEPDMWINPTWKEHIIKYKPYVMINDNNIGFHDNHVYEVIKYLYDNNKKVCFNNGFDCKYMNDKLSYELGKLNYIDGGIRLAFDRIEEDEIFQSSIKKLIKYGVNQEEIIAFVLFNFNDKPYEADYRVNECIKLGIRPFPEIYKAINKTEDDKVYVGKHWTLNLAEAFREFVFNEHYFNYNDFISWINSQSLFKLTDEDLDKWYSK